MSKANADRSGMIENVYSLLVCELKAERLIASRKIMITTERSIVLYMAAPAAPRRGIVDPVSFTGCMRINRRHSLALLLLPALRGLLPGLRSAEAVGYKI